MRFDELRLQAFGPFTNVVLDLRGGAPGGLHVIYGPNEAGKSTSLRAVVNLLFGIPQRSPDAHLHPSSRLAVGARLSAQGKTLDVTRLKRNRDSLVDADGVAWSVDPIPALLGHLDRVSFCTRFGLDQAELEKGAEALLGGSEQGLFAAGTAGADVRRVLSKLGDDAAALFLPRGKLPLLNRYNADYEQALGEARRAERPVEKWLAQARAHEQAVQQVARVGGRRSEVRAELRRLQRLKAVLSDLVEWQTATERLGALSQVPDLPADAPVLRSQCSAQIVESQAEIRRISEDLAAFERELAQLREPSPLADVDDEQLQLAARVGTAIAARKDLPKRRAALVEQQRQLSTLLRELGQDPAPGDEVAGARRVVVGVEGSSHITRLIAQHSGLST
ncbi:MAG TPA: AAA family ATPase, partial [Polyangiaceae bacterium]|nr:AAA family ATPase [Polyangiaceae bacterium]